MPSSADADLRPLRVIAGGRDERERGDERQSFEPYQVPYRDDVDDEYPRRPASFAAGAEDEPDEEDDGRRPPRRSTFTRVALKALITLAALALVGVAAANRDAIMSSVVVADAASVAAPVAALPADPPAAAPQPAPVAATVPLPPVPDVPGLVVLIRNAMVALQQANATGNYSVLRELAAPDFQAANSTGKLADAFADLRSRNLDLAVATVVDPALNQPPAVDSDGRLRLDGFFDAAGTRVDFDLAFQVVDGRWRLFTIGVRPAAEASKDGEEAARVAGAKPEVPDAATIVTLMRETVIALNQANLTGNYSVLRDMAAPGFQQANSFTRLASIFANLRARQVDLGPVAVIDPKLFRPPAIDERGMLRLTGFFASQPEQVNFDLAFQRIDGRWVMFGLGVNTSVETPVADAGAATASDAAPAPEAATAGARAETAAAETPSRNQPPPMPRLRPGELASATVTPALVGPAPVPSAVAATAAPVDIDAAALQPAAMEPSLDPAAAEQGL